MNKNVLIAVLVFAALLVAVMVMRAQPTKVGVKELTIDAVPRDKVAKIEVTLPPRKIPGHGPDAGPSGHGASEEQKPTHVVLERQGASFVVFDAANAAAKFPADDQLIDMALDTLEELKVGDLIANKAEKLAEYEIDDAKGLRAKITTTDGKTLDLVFGRPSKGGGSTVRQANSNDIFVAKGRFGPTVRKDVSQWRKKAIVGTEPDTIKTVVVKPASGTGFTVTASDPAPAEPTDGGVAAPAKPTWALTDPATLPAGFRLDNAQVGRVASAFTGVRAADYAEGVSDDAAGLSGAHTVIEATHKDGKKVVLHLGKEDDKKRVFARVDGDPQLYLVSQHAARQAGRALDDLRDMSLFDAKADDVERASFTGTNGKFVVARVDGAWKLVEPKKAPDNFDIGQVDSALNAALRLKATRLAPAGATATGLDKPVVVVELVLKDGKTQTMRFGAALPPETPATPPPAGTPPPEPTEYYAQGGLDALTYVVPSFTFKRYDRPQDLFKKVSASHGAGGMGGAGGGGGLDSLPPDMRKKLEEALRNQKPPG